MKFFVSLILTKYCKCSQQIALCTCIAIEIESFMLTYSGAAHQAVSVLDAPITTEAMLQSQIQRLQYVQNSAACLLTGTRKYDSITPILKELHWLSVAERIHYKILLLTFKSLNNLASFYLKELVTPYVPMVHCGPQIKVFSEFPDAI